MSGLFWFLISNTINGKCHENPDSFRVWISKMNEFLMWISEEIYSVWCKKFSCTSSVWIFWFLISYTTMASVMKILTVPVVKCQRWIIFYVNFGENIFYLVHKTLLDAKCLEYSGVKLDIQSWKCPTNPESFRIWISKTNEFLMWISEVSQTFCLIVTKFSTEKTLRHIPGIPDTHIFM